MRRAWHYSLILAALPLWPVQAIVKSEVDQLPQSALQSAFQILRRDYIRRDELTMEELNRAALGGLLDRLSFGARLVAANRPAEKAAPSVHSEFLGPDIAYLRPETMTEGEGSLFAKALSSAVERHARNLILDLRGTRAEGSFDEAAVMLQCFVPVGELMFKMKQIGRDDAELFISKTNPLWTGPMLVLVDGETNNAAEAVAACLKQRGVALLIGAATRGIAVRYSEVQLDAQTSLRYASAEMLLPDGAPVFKRGLQPALAVEAVMEEKHKVFGGSRDKSMKPFIVDKVRPRFNERALVGNSNPEIDDYVRRSQGEPLPGDDGQVRDVVTQRALDLLESSDRAAQNKLQWQTESGPNLFDQAAKKAVPKAEPVKP